MTEQTPADALKEALEKFPLKSNNPRRAFIGLDTEKDVLKVVVFAKTVEEEFKLQEYLEMWSLESPTLKDRVVDVNVLAPDHQHGLDKIIPPENREELDYSAARGK